MEQRSEQVVLTPQQLQEMIEAKPHIFIEQNVPTFASGLVSAMMEELKSQVSLRTEAHAASDRKVDRVGAAVSEMGERIRPAEAQAQDRETKMMQQIEALRATV